MNLKVVSKGLKHLVSSSLIVQLLNVLTIPLLSRLYSPQYWGEYSLYLAIFLILSPLSCLSLGGAIIISKKKEEQYRISVISSYFAVLLTLLLITLVCAIDVLSITSFNPQYYYLCLPILMMLHEVTYSWITKLGKFKIIALIFTISALVNILVAVFCKLLFKGISLNGLVLGHLTMYTVQAIAFYYFITKVNGNIFFRYYKTSVLIATLKKYRDFPVFKMPQIFLASFSQGLPVFIFSKVGYIEASGKYGMARKLVGMPSQLIGKALTRVYFKEISYSINKKEKITESLIKSSALIAMVSLPVFLLIIFFGSNIFAFILGKDWAKSGEFAAYLSIWLYFALINKPVTAAIPSLNLQKEFFIYELMLLISRVSAITISIYIYDNLNMAVMYFSLVGMLFNIFLFLFIINKVKKYENY